MKYKGVVMMAVAGLAISLISTSARAQSSDNRLLYAQGSGSSAYGTTTICDDSGINCHNVPTSSLARSGNDAASTRTSGPPCSEAATQPTGEIGCNPSLPSSANGLLMFGALAQMLGFGGQTQHQ